MKHQDDSISSNILEIIYSLITICFCRDASHGNAFGWQLALVSASPKNTTMKKITFAGLFLLLVLFTGCSSTHITSTWKAPDATAGKYKKVMVVGIIREADRTLRVKMENHLVGDLKSLGYNAMSAYEEYGPKELSQLTEEAVNEQLKKDGIDAVVTVVLLDKQKEKNYVPGRVIYTPYYHHYNRFWGYYRTVSDRIEMRGYYEVSTKYFWESNLYDLNLSKLVYSVQTQSFDPVTADKLAHEYGQKIVQSMVKGGVLTKQGESVVKSL